MSGINWSCAERAAPGINIAVAGAPAAMVASAVGHSWLAEVDGSAHKKPQGTRSGPWAIFDRSVRGQGSFFCKNKYIIELKQLRRDYMWNLY